MQLPKNVSRAPHVDTSDLRHALEEIFQKPILSLGRRRSDYSSSFAIEELEVLFENRAATDVIFKDVGPNAMLDVAAALKPAFLYSPRREIEVYRRILSSLGLGTATLYGTAVNPEIERYWLFLERVPGVELYQLGDFEAWLAVARWLARFHASIPCAAVSARAAVPELLEYDAAFSRRWLRRARAVVGSELDWLASRYERIVDVLLGLPRTLIHGEFYAPNILVQTGATSRVSPVDWEMAAIGPGLLDLAALASGKWATEQQTQIAEAYYSALPPTLRPKDFPTALDCCKLQMALQWLGWSDHWVPYEPHAHDWLRQAMELIRREPLHCLLA